MQACFIIYVYVFLLYNICSANKTSKSRKCSVKPWMAKVFQNFSAAMGTQLRNSWGGSTHSRLQAEQLSFQLRLFGEAWVFNIVYLCLHDKMWDGRALCTAIHMDLKLYFRWDFKDFQKPIWSANGALLGIFLTTFLWLGVKSKFTVQKRSFFSSARDFMNLENRLCKMLRSLKRQELTEPYWEERNIMALMRGFWYFFLVKKMVKFQLTGQFSVLFLMWIFLMLIWKKFFLKIYLLIILYMYNVFWSYSPSIISPIPLLLLLSPATPQKAPHFTSILYPVSLMKVLAWAWVSGWLFAGTWGTYQWYINVYMRDSE